MRVAGTRWRTAVAVAVAIFVVAHLLALRSPAYPTGDEALLAGLTRSLMRTGHFQIEPAPQWAEAAVFAYGPVYFAVTAPLIRWLGIGVVQYRLVSLLAGFALVAVLLAILKARRNNEQAMALVTCAFAVDPILTQSMHYGRMDTFAVVLVFGALLMSIRRREPGARAAAWRLLVAGLLVGAAVLTTPRAALTAAPLVVVVPEWRRQRVTEWLADLLLFGLPAVALYAVWMVRVFGGPLDVAHYYSRLSGFVTAHLLVSRVQIPLVLVAGATVVWALVSRPRAFLGPLTVAALAGLVAFYLVVREIWGGYSIYILPFYYILLGEAAGLEQKGRTLPQIVRFALPLLLLVNLAVSVHYATTFLANARPGGSIPLERFIASVIPPGSRVIGDDLFYFAALRTSNSYRFMNQYASDDERERYQRVEFDYQYILWSDRMTREQPALLQLYRSHAPLDLVAEYPDTFTVAPFWRRLGVPPFQSLGVAVYRRRAAAGR